LKNGNGCPEKPCIEVKKSVLRIGAIAILLYAVVVVIVYFWQRSLLYYPSHWSSTDLIHRGVRPWMDGSRMIGYCREIPHPHTIWLMTHGNAGQAAQRDYVLERMSPQDSLYVLEYPGYGAREGKPSLENINRAASEAYQLLHAQNPGIPVCVVGESLGTGPACALALENNPPDKIVLVLPFDVLANAAAVHFPWLPVRLLLRDNWNNVESLKHYSGPVDIFGAVNDTIIPIEFARALAKQVPQAHFTELSCGHNAWAQEPQVKIER
jgi:pimeloyl-ACP methyl ester carboxylesterase